ncbi:MAG: PilZ domain-containing protein, partial [Candidatus Methylomirabilales bacterium]
FNLSGGGLFLCTPEPLPVGERLRVRFTLPAGEIPFEATAQVAWLSEARLGNPYPPGMGVQFLELPLEARDAIAALITAHLPQPPKPSGNTAP